MATTSLNALTAEHLAELMKEYTPRPNTLLMASRGVRDQIEREFPNPDPSPLRQGSIGDFSFGVRVLDIPREQVYDWSTCRSPSRAKRRHAQGHKQRVTVTERDVAYVVNDSFMRNWWNEYADRSVAKLLYGD